MIEEKNVYLTYEKHDDEVFEMTDLYKYKLKRYDDGTCMLYEYKNIRIKPGKRQAKLSSSINKNSLVIDDELYNLREEYRKNYIYKVKRKVNDYVINNDFDMFWTLTFDSKKVEDKDEYRFSEMSKWLRRMRDKYGKFRYIAIPERHKSGAIHWHMVTGGLVCSLRNSGIKRNNVVVYNSLDWEYGFTDVQKVRSKKKVASYVSKYITKDLMDSPAAKYKKKYWVSTGLKLPLVEYGNPKFNNIDLELYLTEPPYENDVVKIFKLTEEELSELEFLVEYI